MNIYKFSYKYRCVLINARAKSASNLELFREIGRNLPSNFDCIRQSFLNQEQN